MLSAMIPMSLQTYYYSLIFLVDINLKQAQVPIDPEKINLRKQQK